MKITEYTYCGDPIPDIEAWAKERGQLVVEFTYSEKDPLTGEWSREDSGVMPEAFWVPLRHDSMTRYREVRRRAPLGVVPS